MSIGSDEHPPDPAWWFERELELGLDTLDTLDALEPGRSPEPA